MTSTRLDYFDSSPIPSYDRLHREEVRPDQERMMGCRSSVWTTRGPDLVKVKDKTGDSVVTQDFQT